MDRRRHDPKSRYEYATRKQQKELEEYAAWECEWAEDFLNWCKCRNEDMGEEEYRAVAFFMNREFLRKPGSLTALYLMHKQLLKELPESTKESAFYQLAYRYKVYAEVLKKGNWD